MKILSLNIQHGGGSRLPKILDYIDSVNLDICILSEFRHNKNGAEITKFFSEKGFEYQSPAGLDPKKNTILVASKNPIKPNLFDMPNGWSCSSVQQESIQVVGVYFPLKAEKKEVFDWFLSSSRSWNRTIVVGDFNTGISKYDLEGRSKFHCEEEFRKLSQEVLRDCYRILHPDGKDYSWHSSIGNGFRIDHALCSPDLSGQIASVVYDHNTRHGISDHSALLMELELAQTNASLDKIKNLKRLIERDNTSFRTNRTHYDFSISDELANAYIDLIDEVEPFDWRQWRRGLDAIKSGSDFSDFTIEELMKALLAIFRGNRFTEGVWAKYLSDGTILRILHKLIEKLR